MRRFPELAEVRKAGAARLRVFYTKHNVRSEERIAERLALLGRARPLSKDRAVIGPARLELARLLDLIEVEARHIAGMEERIAEVFAAHTAFGDVAERYPDAQSLQKYAGVAPVREKSQNREWVHWRWAAPLFVRQSLVEWAGQTVTRSVWAGEFYLRQKAAGKGHHAILRALAFKSLRILWRCWKDNVPYDETRYLAALAIQASPRSAA